MRFGALAFGLALVGCGGGETPPQVRAPETGRGRLLYVEGRLESDRATEATVLGDVPVTGDQVRCASCHGRSGLGVEETSSRTPPVAGPLLFDPEGRAGRPGYTRATLGKALREGVDPTGRSLDPLMPRYQNLTDDDVAALADYLDTLGPEDDAAISEHHVRFATVVAGDVPADRRDALAAVLTAFADDKNAQTRRDADRASARIEEDRTRVPFREWSVDVWELTGPPEGWGAQLAAKHREKPVFAVIGGVADGPWGPIQDFCEAARLPCLFPATQEPGALDGEFYTVYFSGGLPAEARVVAADLGPSARVVQVIPPGDPTLARTAQALDEAVTKAGGSAKTLTLGPEVDLAAVLAEPADAIVLWLDDAALAGLSGASEGAPVVLSTTLAHLEAVPEALRGRVRLVDPYRSPSGVDPGLRRFQLWSGQRGVAITHEDLQARAWFACMAVSRGMRHIATHASRDYLLDTLDHSAGMVEMMPFYRRAEVGPGRRWLSKGAWIVPAEGEARWRSP